MARPVQQGAQASQRSWTFAEQENCIEEKIASQLANGEGKGEENPKTFFCKNFHSGSVQFSVNQVLGSLITINHYLYKWLKGI